MTTKLLLTGPHVDRALTLLALIQASANPVERNRYEHSLKVLRSAHPEVYDIRDDDSRIEGKVREIREAFDGREECPNCGKRADFKERSSHNVETHGLDCGPYETWDETWLVCSECGAETDAKEIAANRRAR